MHPGHSMSGPQWMWMPSGSPTWARLFAWHPQPVPISLVLCLICAALYVAGVVQMHRRGLRWPVSHSLFFALGTALVVLMTGTAFNGYSMVLFSVHMAQHMVLSMLAPVLVLMGRPLTLLLRALPSSSPTRHLVLQVLHSRFAKVATALWWTLPMYLVTMYGIYFSSWFDVLMAHWFTHELMLVYFICAGLLLYWPILGLDPAPYTLPPGLAFVAALLPMPFHAFFSVIVMDAGGLMVRTFTNPPAAWGIDPAHDQRLGGGISWAFSDLPSLTIALVIAVRWWRSSNREAKRHDRDEDRTGDAQLKAYNEWLASLEAEQSER